MYKSECESRIRKKSQEDQFGYRFNEILGDTFKSNGIEVHYSKIDNADTLATFAHLDGAFILSEN